jgi:hypothetical protein
MNKFYRLIYLLVLFSSETLYSQTDSVLAYMPLEIGNQWQYKVHRIVYGPPHTDTTTYYSFSRVERDTIMPNGYQYQVISSTKFATRYVHIDSATACVYEYENDSSRGLKTDSLRCSQGDWFGRGSYCEFIDTATVLNYQTWVMSIDRSSPDITVRHTLAMNVGMIYKYIYESFGWGTEEISNLVYAKINGNEFGELVVSQDDFRNELTGFNLHQNHPNPFNPTTTIKYQIPELSFVTLKVYDVLGNEIALLVNGEKPAGKYEIEFDASRLPSGVYFYTLKTAEFVYSKKMILIK